MPRLLCILRRPDGQTMAEYAVVLSVITPAIVLAVAILSGAEFNVFQRVVNLI